MEFKGRIYKVYPVQSGTSARGNEWRKQDFVFEYFEHDTDRWSDKVLLSVMNERIEEYDLHEGDECIIGFGHSVSNEWKGRVFNELRLYKFEKIGASAKPSPTENGAASGATPAAPQQGNLFAQTPQQAPQSTQGVAVAQQPTAASANAQKGEKEDELPF